MRKRYLKFDIFNKIRIQETVRARQYGLDGRIALVKLEPVNDDVMAGIYFDNKKPMGITLFPSDLDILWDGERYFIMVESDVPLPTEP